MCEDSKWIERHPKILMLDVKLELNELLNRMATNELMPRLDLNAKLELDTLSLNEGSSNNYFIGLDGESSILLRKGRGISNMAKANQRALQAKRGVQGRELRQKCRAAYQVLSGYEDATGFLSSRVSAMTRLTEAAQSEFAVGAGDLIDVNVRESKEIKARIEYIENLGAAHINAVRLFAMMRLAPKSYLDALFASELSN